MFISVRCPGQDRFRITLASLQQSNGDAKAPDRQLTCASRPGPVTYEGKRQAQEAAAEPLCPQACRPSHQGEADLAAAAIDIAAKGLTGCINLAHAVCFGVIAQRIVGLRGWMHTRLDGLMM